MTTGLVFGLVALLATLSATELVRVFAHRVHAVDRPGGRRVHRRPTARLGGLGIYWGFYLALAVASVLPGLDVTMDRGLVGVMIGSSLLLVVGVLDDVRGLPAVSKLVFQVLAAVVLCRWGWRVEHLGIPGIGSWTTGMWSLPLTVAWVVGVTNAFNLIDGLDGLAAGIALVAALATCVLLIPGPHALTMLAVALIGALVGFLWFNLSPALIFMGDAGSLFVGFVVSALTLRAGTLGSPEAFPLVPMLVVAVPVLDMLVTIARRASAARAETSTPAAFVWSVAGRVAAPDGEHVHHRLIRAGYSTRQAVSTLWLVALSFAVAGVVMTRSIVAGIAMVAVSLGVSLVVARRVETRLARAVPSPVTWPDGVADPSDDAPERKAA